MQEFKIDQIAIDSRFGLLEDPFELESFYFVCLTSNKSKPPLNHLRFCRNILTGRNKTAIANEYNNLSQLINISFDKSINGCTKLHKNNWQRPIHR